MRIGAGEKKARHVRRLHFRRPPVHRVLLRRGDRNRRDRAAADQRTEVKQPLLAEQPDVEVDAIQRAERAHRIGPIFQHPRRPGRARPGEELRQRIVCRQVVVELLVVQATTRNRLPAPFPRLEHARQQVVDGVHRPGIADAVGRDERRIERARPRDMQRLIEEAAFRPIAAPVEDAIPPEILGADVGAELLPFGVLGIRRRPDRIRADVTEPARHRDTVRPDEIAIQVVRRIVVEPVGVPALARLLVEIRIREQPQADDAGRLAVVGADGHGSAAGADLDAGISLRIGKRIRRAGRIADVEP